MATTITTQQPTMALVHPPALSSTSSARPSSRHPRQRVSALKREKIRVIRAPRHAHVPIIYNTQKWMRFMDKCLRVRLDIRRFAQFAPLQQRKFPVPPHILTDLLMRPRTRKNPVPLQEVIGLPSTISSTNAAIDPRLPEYLQELLRLRMVDVPCVLQSLYRCSTSQLMAHKLAEEERKAAEEQKQEADQKRPKAYYCRPPVVWANSYANEEMTFYRLTRAVRNGTALRTSREALVMAGCMVVWMDLFAVAAAATESQVPGVVGAGDRDMTIEEQIQEEMGSARAAFVMLLLAVCENAQLRQVLGMRRAKLIRRELSSSISNFIPTIALTSTHITVELEQFRSEVLASFEPASKKTPPEESGLNDLLDSTVGLRSLVLPDIPMVNSRAGLYIYLNACLVGRPLIDDTALFTYLHNRFQGDLQTMATDLILASFDVLANAVFRTESQVSAHVLRSFLLNKVPLLLVSLASSPLYHVNTEFCISEALGRLDANAFPTMSSMFDDNHTATPLTYSARQDFCFACCLHGLISDSSIETLLGEMTYQTLPVSGRLSKEGLVPPCLGGVDGVINPGRITGLINLLDDMEGNAGAAGQALAAVLGHLCARRETAALKDLCIRLVRKPLAFDVLLLFVKPSAILWPLCRLLDGWRTYDDDRSGNGGGGGEYHGMYEEFGAVVFLLLAFVQRYNISAADVGIHWPADSFVARLMTTGHIGRTLAEISNEERDNLGNWIRSLFDTDDGGLSDDIMASCPPQQFYLLVPTLFQQIVQAVSGNALSDDMLKIGIEYLVDTFLLPSLITALLYLSDMLRVERPAEQRAILRVLRLILQQASRSSETEVGLAALLNIVARPLEHALRAYQRQEPKIQEIDPLLNELRQKISSISGNTGGGNGSGSNARGGGGNANGSAPTNSASFLLPSRRTAAAEHKELSLANTSNNGGLAAALRQTIQGYVQWSMHPGVDIMPTWHSLRLFLAALRLMGAPRVLQVILEELQRQTDAGNVSIALDVACAIVCAPDVTNEPSPELVYVPQKRAGDADADGGGSGDMGVGAGLHSSNVEDKVVPNTVVVQRRLSLRQALAFRAQEWKKSSAATERRERDQAPPPPAVDPVPTTETIVRLYRKVEAQMAPAQVPAGVVTAVDMAGGLAGALSADELAGDLADNLTGGLATDLANSMAGDLTSSLTESILGGADAVTAAAAAAAAAAGLDSAAMESMAAAAAAVAVGDGAEAMVLDGGGVGGMAATGSAGAGAASGGEGSAVVELADLGDLGDLAGLEDLGGIDGMGDMGGSSGLDMGDQSMFSEMDILNSWMDIP